MKLHRPSDVSLYGGRVCRQSRVMSLGGGALMCGVLVGAALFWWYVEAPWIVWGGCAVLAALVVPMILGTIMAAFHPANWVLLIKPDGLWINLRSHLNHRLPEALTVLHLPYGQIARANEHVDTYATPSGRHGTTSRRGRVRSLDLHLNHRETDALRTALEEERGRKGYMRKYGPVTVASKSRHYPVTLPQPGVVRIAWRGGRGNMVVPSLGRTLEAIGRYVSVEDRTERDRPEWTALSDEEVDDLVLELVQAGDTMAAVRLLVRRRDLSLTEARRFVEELA